MQSRVMRMLHLGKFQPEGSCRSLAKSEVSARSQLVQGVVSLEARLQCFLSPIDLWPNFPERIDLFLFLNLWDKAPSAKRRLLEEGKKVEGRVREGRGESKGWID